MSFRFVHTADLHLDSPFKGVGQVDGALAKSLQRATFDAYENIVRLCLEEKVDALIVAGDVYDGADRSLRAQLAFHEGLERLAEAGISSFIAHGNHDPLDGWQAELLLPGLAHRFGPQVETVATQSRGGERVAVHGFGYPTRVVTENIAERFRADPVADVNIAVLHGTVGTQPGHDPYAPCSVADLEAAGMDYWAMGHVHERQVLREAHPAVVYPGNPQGRHLKERGARGVYLVDVEPGLRPVLEFRPVDVVRWERRALGIAGLRSEQDLLDAVTDLTAREALAGEGRLVVLALSLAGSGPMHGWLQRAGVTDDLLLHANAEAEARGQHVVLITIEDETFPENWAEETGAGGFVAEVLQVAASLRRDPGDEVDAALADLRGHPALRGFAFDDLELAALIERAEVVAVDALREARA